MVGRFSYHEVSPYVELCCTEGDRRMAESYMVRAIWHYSSDRNQRGAESPQNAKYGLCGGRRLTVSAGAYRLDYEGGAVLRCGIEKRIDISASSGYWYGRAYLLPQRRQSHVGGYLWQKFGASGGR